PASYNPDQLNLKFCRPLLASDGKLYYSYIHLGYAGDFFRMSSYDMATNTRTELTNGQNLFYNHDFEAVGLTEVSPGKILTCFRDSVYVYDFNDTAYTTRKYSHDMNLYGFFKGNYTVASNGRIYGTTKMKGYDVTPPVPLGNSVIFSLNPVNFDFQVEYTFDATIKNCNAGLTEINGKLYGSTNYGGTNNNGYLFSFDIATQAMTILYSFDRTIDGAGFEGEWTVLNGKLYSTSYTGGANGYGTLAEYDPLTTTFTVLKQLTMADGRSFRGTPLVYTHGVPINSEVSGKISQGQSLCAGAWQTITVAGGGTSFEVCCGGFANMVAGTNILYLPGTWIKHGGNMHGYIDAGEPFCGIQPPLLPSYEKGESETKSEVQPIATLPNRTFSIYPNPASGSFTIAQTDEKTYSSVNAEIYSMHGGRVLVKELYNEKKHLIPTSDLQNGLYFVKITADGYVENIKLVITK
ncbi:MAG: choice-of-anchor tandem repeat GloVer-containing protein, partial [Bacteroidota bacterium]